MCILGHFPCIGIFALYVYTSVLSPCRSNNVLCWQVLSGACHSILLGDGATIDLISWFVPYATDRECSVACMYSMVWCDGWSRVSSDTMAVWGAVTLSVSSSF